MIRSDAVSCVLRLPLSSLSVGETRSLDMRRVQEYAELLTDNPDHDMEPVIVESEGNKFKILNGHHRFVGYIVAGRPNIFAVVVNNPDKAVSGTDVLENPLNMRAG